MTDDPVIQMKRAVVALGAEVPEDVWTDLRQRWNAVAGHVKELRAERSELVDELLIAHGKLACAMSVAAALGPVLDLWACDHVPRLGVEVDPECARCKTMGPLREAYRTLVVEAAPDDVIAP